jgi:hypothetical protein
MASVTLELPEETRRRLEDKAAQKGQPLEIYIRDVLEAEADTANGVPRLMEPPPQVRRMSVEEFNRRLDEMQRFPLPSFPPLPDDFSRADLYDDHD